MAVGAGLVVLTFAAFRDVAFHPFIGYDDNVYVSENPNVEQGLTAPAVVWAFTTSYHANWHPLTSLSHMLDVELFGLDAGKHHMIGLLLHASNVVLLFLLLVRMTGARWRSAFVSAFFALHPLHVESVAWVAERKDVLSMLFCPSAPCLPRRASAQPESTSPAESGFGVSTARQVSLRDGSQEEPTG